MITTIILYYLWYIILSGGSAANASRPPSQFFHPNTGLPIGVTSFQRRSYQRDCWDTAGHVDWASMTSAKVAFGTEEVRYSCYSCCSYSSY